MSPRGNHTLAIINSTEDYDSLKLSLADLIQEVKSLSSITVDNESFPIEYFLCSDLKFLAIVCGIESANSTYPCVWCTCPSSERHDMTQNWSFSDTCAWTVETITACSCKIKKSERLGCKHPPLFTIPIDHVIPDNLHLYLRITDVLFNLLFTDIQHYDAVTELSNDGISTYTYLEQFEFYINITCKIPFHFKEDDKSKDITWRDLMGPEKHRFQKNFTAWIIP